MKLIKTEALREIRTLHSEIVLQAKTTLEKAIRIGELLTQVKTSLPHGQWLPWLKEHVAFTRATAANYMRCWERREELRSKSVLHLGDAYRLMAGTDDVDFEIDPDDLASAKNCLSRIVERLDSMKNQLASGLITLDEVREIARQAQRIELICHRSEADCLALLGNSLDSSVTNAP